MSKPGKNTRSTLLGHSAAIFLIRLAPALAAMAALILFSRNTTPEFYGRYQSFWVQWQVLSTVACIGLPALIFTYPLAQVTRLIGSLRAAHKVLFAAWITAISLAFSGVQSLAGKPLIPLLEAALFLAFSVPVILCEAYLMLCRRFSLVALCSMGYSVLFIAGHLLFIRHILSIREVFLLVICANALRLACLLLAARRMHREQDKEASASRPAIVKSLWFHLAVYDGVQMLFRWIDKLVLGFLLLAPQFALYFNGTVDVPFLPLLLGAAGSALLMQLSSDMPDDGRIELLKESGSTLSRIVFPVFFFLVLFRHELFGVLFKHRYDGATTLFFISSLVIPLRAYNFTSILQHKGKGHLINIGAVLDLAVAIVLAWPLYLLLGLNGVALAFVLSTYFQAAFYLAWTARIMQVKVGQLLPLSAWAAQLIVFLILFIVLYYVMHHYFHEGLALFLGTGTLMFTLIAALLPVLLSKRKRAHGTQL